jgi:GTPase
VERALLVSVQSKSGQGKVFELQVRSKNCGAAVVIFDQNLSPAQVMNIEGIANVKIIDRTRLILDIFARSQTSR